MRAVFLMVGLGGFVLWAVNGCDPEGAQDAMLDREIRAAQVLVDYARQNETALAQARNINTVGWAAPDQSAFLTALNAYQAAYDTYDARESELQAADVGTVARVRQLASEQARVDAARAEFMAVVSRLRSGL